MIAGIRMTVEMRTTNGDIDEQHDRLTEHLTDLAATLRGAASHLTLA